MAQADFVQRGRQLCAQAQYQEAVKVCRLGLLAHPTEVEGRLVLGEALLALSRYDEVLAEMRVALELDGDNPRALGLKGASLLRKGDVLQACDVLARAVTASPSDPALRQLYGEARAAREGAQMPGPGMGSYRGGGSPVLGGPIHAPPDVLEPGDQSGTIEIDPDVEGVEFVSGSIRTPAGRDQSEPSIELSTSDLLPGGIPTGFEVIDGPFAPRPSARIPPLEAPVDRQLTGPSPKLARSMGFPGPSGPPGPAAAPRTMTPAAAPAARRSMMYGDLSGRPVARRGAPIDEMFPEDEGGVSKMELDPLPHPGAPPGPQRLERPGWNGPQGGAMTGRGPGPAQAGSRTGFRSRTDDMRMIRQGLGLAPDGTVAGAPIPRPLPQQPGPWAGGSPPGLPPGPPPGMYPTVSGALPAGLQQSRQPPPPRKTGRDRAGLWGRQSQHQPVRDLRTAGRPILSRAGLSSMPLIVYALLALVVVGGAVLAGFKVRSVRLSGQIEGTREEADRAAATDTYLGYLIAVDAYGRIADAAGDDESQASQASMTARMAAEAGDGLEQARRLVSELDPENPSPDSHAARAFLAVAEEDAQRATKAANSLRQSAPEHPDALHLAGRAALLSERSTDAAQLLRAALEKHPRPAIAVALARAEAVQGRFDEARAALDRAFQMRPKHAAATVWAARIAIWGKSFPTRAGEPEGSLDAVIQEGAKPPAQQTIGASPGQAAWAALALAEVRLARGDRAGAQHALGAAQAARASGGFAFRSAMVEMLVELGELAAARAQVELAVKEWPRTVASRVLEARVAMASGDPGSALAALEKAGDLSHHPEAMALRGRARLATGSPDQAAADLDAALALRSDQQGAILARAEVDLARGDARMARKRLAPLYGNGSAAPVEVVAAYAASFRQSGDRGEARKMLAALAESRPAEAADWRILFEQARLARAEGSFKAAAERYEKAIAAAPRALEPRMERALLALDIGDLAGARSRLDALVAEGGQSGLVLVEAAQVRSLTGDHKGAGELLDRAAALPSPSWKVARERGRLLMRQRRPEQAAAELERAKAAALDDGETRFLLMEAYFLAKNRRGAARELVQLTKSFRGTPLLAMSRGLEALTREKWDDAAEELQRGHAMAMDDGEPPRMLGRAAYWTGRAFYLDAKMSRAIDWLERAIEHDPSQADAHYLLGQIAYESRSPDRMARRFEKAVSLDPGGNPSAWFFLGEHYLGNRRYPQARQALQTYLERWPEADFSTDARDLLSKIP